MKIDTTLPPTFLKAIPDMVRAAEAIGFDGVWTTETQHNPFLPGPLIAEHTTQIQFGTAVAIAFARSPATMAYTAWDLAQMSKGRFILGLGTQVKGHIERRFGMNWPDSVVGKLRDQIGAIRALWHSWQTGERLNFRGDYYKLTLMSPFFNPGPCQYPDISIYIAGVNTGLASLAGEVADGFHVHPLHSPRYLKEVIIPAIESGAAQANRKRADISISVPVFVVTNKGEQTYMRQQISFYASTPSYRQVFALHGWEDIAERLSSFAARGRWGEMPAQISDEILTTFAVVAEPEDLPCLLKERYQGLADRLGLYIPYRPGEKDEFWQHLIREMQ